MDNFGSTGSEDPLVLQDVDRTCTILFASAPLLVMRRYSLRRHPVRLRNEEQGRRAEAEVSGRTQEEPFSVTSAWHEVPMASWLELTTGCIQSRASRLQRAKKERSIGLIIMTASLGRGSLSSASNFCPL